MKYSGFVEVYERLSKTTKRLEKTDILSEFLKKLSKDDDEEWIYLIRGKVLPDYDSREFGVSGQLIIKVISKASGVSSEIIGQKFNKLGDLGEVAEELMKNRKQAPLYSKKLTVDKVFDNLRKLFDLDGKGSVDKKTSLIAELLTNSNGTEAKWIVRTVLGDLRIGVADSTLRDSLAEAFDSENKKELAHKIEDVYDLNNDFGEIFRALKKGKKELDKISFFKIRTSTQIVTDSEEKAMEFNHKALDLGEEGIMIKKLDSVYKPGRYIGYMVKMKPEAKDLDLVITSAEYGTGKRAGWLTSYIVACHKDGKYLNVGKVASGLKEIESENGTTYSEMTELLKPLIVSEKGNRVKVKPKIVVSVTYQNIQKSPTYSSGFAMRFPRITHYRPDRNIKDIASLKDIEKETKTND